MRKNNLKKKRQKRGASTTPNLFYSGLMLSNMQPKKTGKLRRKIYSFTNAIIVIVY